MIAALFDQILPWVIGAVALLVAVFTKGKLDQRKGRKQERRIQEEKDREKADDVRKRVRDTKRVRGDNLEYRD